MRLPSLFAALSLAFAASAPGAPAAVALVDPTLHGDAIVRTLPGEAASVAAFARRAGATNVVALDGLDMVTAHLDAAATRSLAADVAVREISSDGAIVAADGGDEADRTSQPGREVFAGLAARSFSPGSGTVVAVVDSGIADVPDLAGKVVARADFVKDGATSLDPGGHGTFLAGLIAGRSVGADPNAKLVDLRVLNSQGVGTVGGALASFDWLLRNRVTYRVRVVNLSWGATQKLSYHQDVLTAAAESLWFSGMTVVAAAGNKGPQPGTINTPGADPFVITVGSLNQQSTFATSDDRESVWSSRGPTLDGFAKPDVLAPGEDVVSLRVPGSYLDRTFPDRQVEGSTSLSRMSGTSVAAAIASGVAALEFEWHANWTPTIVKTSFVRTARPVTGSTTPVLNAAAALGFWPRPNVALANAGLRPSLLLLQVLKGSIAGSNITWETITWETITWENITWENVSWESVTWESVTWESVTWESVTWEALGP